VGERVFELEKVLKTLLGVIKESGNVFLAHLTSYLVLQVINKI